MQSGHYTTTVYFPIKLSLEESTEKNSKYFRGAPTQLLYLYSRDSGPLNMILIPPPPPPMDWATVAETNQIR